MLIHETMPPGPRRAYLCKYGADCHGLSHDIRSRNGSVLLCRTDEAHDKEQGEAVRLGDALEWLSRPRIRQLFHLGSCEEGCL